VSPAERVRAAIATLATWDFSHSDGCPHRYCEGPCDAGAGAPCEDGIEEPCTPEICSGAAIAELCGAAQVLLDETSKVPVNRADVPAALEAGHPVQGGRPEAAAGAAVSAARGEGQLSSEPWTLRVWGEDEEEPDDPNASGDPREAAELYAELAFHQGDYPMLQEIRVRGTSGEVEVFDVETEMAPTFIARRRRAC